MDLPNRIYLALHPIGMAFAILVLASIIGLFFINRQLTNRMTVRLVAAIAFTDLLSHIGEYYAVENYDLIAGTTLCTSVNGFRLFARTFYCWVNMAICFHIYRSLVLLKKTTWRSEVYIWAATAVFVVAETLIYYGLGAFTGVVARKRCTPGVEDYSKNLAFLMFQSLTNLLTIVIGIFVTIKSHSNLNKWINVMSATATEQGEDRDQLISERRKMAVRSFLYPLSACITLPFEAIFLICTAAGTYVYELVVCMALSTGFAGILTAAAFAIDPTTHKAFKAAYYQIKYKDSDKKGSAEEYGMIDF
ncbi:hypothetical protein CONCODRAFT_3292 [Conidiobolus coronatus NRRL 28638]|uniref:G-protein coupled receptors family 1 profile domain-containing protein n=1 Tax=Conidiobolus coronatus (strain ATCC 28846 / CBS 209.66 / NRRL 28638) TaxID=796925 RepID=A0A137PFH1_CONC2|nr:hypothetical protein CONCODRAFT_3292 [Conidiobolus coronatus NRRL 28638]|eukprot:KXN73732.1 hypothetical protein CONCODRAFT_3292 [Conidiobolus coronatus NRRL 28638]